MEWPTKTITFSLRDESRAIHNELDRCFADELMVALSDGPEDLSELAIALQRIREGVGADVALSEWSSRDAAKPSSTGHMLVDLPARLILYWSGATSIHDSGKLVLHDDRNSRRHTYYYSLSDDWTISKSFDNWQEHVRHRREERKQRPRFNVRQVLYNDVAEFLVEQCASARGGRIGDNGDWSPPQGWSWAELREGTSANKRHTIDDAISEIHARWLMTPNDRLGEQTPRAAILAEMNEVERQVRMREFEWVANNEQPTPLATNVTAYHMAGVGRHEAIVYYDLVRHLTKQCWRLVVEKDRLRKSSEKKRIRRTLDRIREQWLTNPRDALSDMRPCDIIESERRRLPLSTDCVDHEDDGCPLCQLARDMGPGFWHFDGSHMDLQYAFSLEDISFEEWEAEQAQWDEIAESFAAEPDNTPVSDSPPNAGDTGDGWLTDADAPGDDIWHNCSSHGDPFESSIVALFVIGAHVAEISGVLRSADPDTPWTDTLNGHYANLRDALRGDAACLLQPVADNFANELTELAQRHEEVKDRCEALAQEVLTCVTRFDAVF